MFTKKSLSETITALLVFLFLYTGLSKYVEFESFRVTLHQSPLLANFSKAIAVSLPGLEILVTLLLILPKTRRTGFVISFCILTIFTGYLIYMIRTDPNLPCTCGGVIAKMSWPQHVIFNIFFLALTGVGLFLERADGTTRPLATSK